MNWFYRNMSCHKYILFINSMQNVIECLLIKSKSINFQLKLSIQVEKYHITWKYYYEIT